MEDTYWTLILSGMVGLLWWQASSVAAAGPPTKDATRSFSLSVYKKQFSSSICTLCRTLGKLSLVARELNISTVRKAEFVPPADLSPNSREA